MLSTVRECRIDGCFKESRNKGVCNMHAHRMEVGLPLDVNYVGRKVSVHKKCSIEECERENYAKNACRFHYARIQRGDEQIDRPYNATDSSVVRAKATKIVDCTFASCERKAKAKGLCISHYNQRLMGKQMVEIRYMRPRTECIKDAEGRQCSKCLTYKLYQEFYPRSRGGFKSSCKQCSIAQAAIDQWKRDPSKYVEPVWAMLYLEELNQKNSVS